MIDLRARFGSTYRISVDESAKISGQTKEDRLWNYRIPCKYGHIYVHGRETLGAYCDRRLIRSRLLAIPGVKIHQQGDVEIAVTFPPDTLGQVADLLQARKRVVISEERREQCREIGKRLQEKFGRVNREKASPQVA